MNNFSQSSGIEPLKAIFISPMLIAVSVNYADLPVNKPRCPVHKYHRDGFMRFDGNYGGAVIYEPNSFDGPVEDPSFKEPSLKITGDADRYDHRLGNAIVLKIVQTGGAEKI